MRFVEEFRNHKQVKLIVDTIKSTITRPWHIMEICGGQTHAIARYRLEELLPDKLTLLHGPGCPVCVTPVSILDHALEIAQKKEIIFTSFGDMLRVPGSEDYLLSIKAKGGDVRILYSTIDAIKIAEENPQKEVVFFAVGFETTIPVHLMAVKEAIRKNIGNFSILTSLFTVPAAIDTILSDKNCNVDSFLAAGHVCAVMGYKEYIPLSKRYKKPIIVTGFEPLDILLGIYRSIIQLESGRSEVENAYPRIVTEEGNTIMQSLIKEYLEPSTPEWRGIGEIPLSGLRLKEKYRQYDASAKFPHEKKFYIQANLQCIAGDIMKGNKQVRDCPYFNKQCNPENPLGAPMVSAEGVCSAYLNY
jgi:hydrogenase expression/formation protein HypD